MQNITFNEKEYQLLLVGDSGNTKPYPDIVSVTCHNIDLEEYKHTQEILTRFLKCAGVPDSTILGLKNTHEYIKYVHDEVQNGNITSTQMEDINFYGVMQSQHFKDDKANGIIQAPKYDKRGGKPEHHWRIMDVKQGDVIFSVVDGKIVALSEANDKGYLDSTDNFIAHINYNDLLTPIDLTIPSIMNVLASLSPVGSDSCFLSPEAGKKPGSRKPKKPGAGKLGYLFKLSDELKDYLLDLIEKGGNTGFTAKYRRRSEKMRITDLLDEYINQYDIKQIVLTGAPGTGKTHSAKKFAERLDPNYKFVQFHPSYDYTDFVEGLRPVMINITPSGEQQAFVRLDGIFKDFCRKVIDDNINFYYSKHLDSYAKYSDFETDYKEFEEKWFQMDKEENGKKLDKHFFIIDEINRADLSKVFGELMYCLEDGYRGIKGVMETQYKNLPTYEIKDLSGKKNAVELKFDCFENGFFIPHNVYIIGTMNDIDRSVEAFDFALRRRFKWIDVPANEVLDDALDEMFGVSCPKLSELKNNIKEMNGIISNDDRFMLNESYHIGHAYFKKFDGSNPKSSLEKIFDTDITSIIKEYTRGKPSVDVKNFLTQCREALLAGF